ncbi:MAG: hypothetical protein JO008_00090 [Alphaproteobacteria bacterium]|nr:hypothetical protein [Alphaproteobacteria bacterium]
MSQHIDPMRLLGNPPARRLWLLQEAMRSLPLDRAIELARIAEAFVVGSAVEAARSEVAPPVDNEERGQIVDHVSTSAAVPADSAPKRNGLALSDNDRERLLDRLANGARNAQLAAEFGISAKRVQGLRMGCAREIARRRAGIAGNDQSPENSQNPATTISIDEIVRYVRQQDDVVVPQEDGSYLVNSRFRLSAAELIARANRMRSRQRKASFQIHSVDVQVASGPGATRHPLFWSNPPAAKHDTNGWKKPAHIDSESE